VALKTAALVEGFGPGTFEAHSNDAEYILTDSIERRLCRPARMIMDVATGTACSAAPLADLP
jgi:glutamate carboxypeptidase